MTPLVGVDVGGTSIKAGVFDPRTGGFLRRREVPTPADAAPSEIARVVRELLGSIEADEDEPIGVCLPAIVVDGEVRSAANIAPAWVGTAAQSLFAQELGRRVVVLNDADAAGLAEISELSEAQRAGVVIVVTLGTGVGSAVFTDGRLTPNTELGHLHLGGELVDSHVGFSAVRREGISVDTWARRVAAYLEHLQRLFSPTLLVIGGGGGIYFGQIRAHLPDHVPAVAARHGNDGGIIGAAVVAARGPRDAIGGRLP